VRIVLAVSGASGAGASGAAKLDELKALARDWLSHGVGCKHLAKILDIDIEEFWGILDGLEVPSEEDTDKHLKKLRSL
jgi:cytidylate kinase